MPYASRPLPVGQLLTQPSYVINSEAAKKLYATMKNRPSAANEPKDLSKEWHSDGESSTAMLHACEGATGYNYYFPLCTVW